MKERCKPYNIDILVRVKEFAQSFHRVRSCFRLTDVKGNLRLDVPVVDNRIVHMYGIPHDIGKKAYRILMKRLCADCDIAAFFVIRPMIGRDNLTGRAVDNLPPSCNVVVAVDLEHIGIKMIHQMNFKLVFRCGVKRGHDVHLLNLVRVCLCPFVIFTGGVVGGVHLSAGIL